MSKANLQTTIDHFVVAADNLSQGVEYIKRELGVEMPYGGEHEKMGTHNHLMQLGSDVFFEIITINPDVSSPDRPRWYALDDPVIKQQIEIEPRLLTWVVNTSNITHTLRQADLDFGKSEKITRGRLSWYFALPGDGRIFHNGTLPYIMQWNTDIHPAAQMAELGCRFKSLDIYHPQPQWLLQTLKSIDFECPDNVNVVKSKSSQYISLQLETPKGLKTLSSVLV